MGCSIDDARRVKEKTKKLLGEHPSVIGIGITRVQDGYGVKVNLDRDLPSGSNLATSIDGVPIQYEVVGKIYKQEP